MCVVTNCPFAASKLYHLSAFISAVHTFVLCNTSVVAYTAYVKICHEC